MLRSEQVFGAIVGPIAGGTIALVSAIVLSSPSSAKSVNNAIDHSVVNQYYAPQGIPINSGPSTPSTAPCPDEQLDTIQSQDASLQLLGKTGTSSCWSEAVDAAPPNAIVTIVLEYKNISHAQQNDVVLRVNLPTGFHVVPDSTYLGHQYCPLGCLITDTKLIDTGINVGSYAPGANAWIIFAIYIPTNEHLACGQATLALSGAVQPNAAAPSPLETVQQALPLRIRKPC
jgi:hypothetical protein